MVAGCLGNTLTPEHEACRQFEEAAGETCPGEDFTPYIGSCANYGHKPVECDYIAYFECLTDVLECDPETAEPNFVAWLPCFAVADCKDPE